MVINRATIWNAMHITAMWVKLETERGRKSEDLDAEAFFLAMIGKIKRPDHAVFVAMENNLPVAFISGSIGYRDYTLTASGQCDYLYVEPEHREKGIGNLLINALRDFVASNNAAYEEIVTDYIPQLVERWVRRGFEPVQVIYRREV